MAEEAQAPEAPKIPEGPKRTKDKVCIVGCADSKGEAPFHLEKEFEFWGVNNLYGTMKGPWSRWFEIHEIKKEGEQWLRRGKADFRGQPVKDYLEGLQRIGCPVYMQAGNPIVTNAVPYPLEAIVKNFSNYFTNTISYEVALAIHEGFKEIHMVGVDMAVDSEYWHQRPSVEMYLGVAIGRGIKVWLPDSCDLLKTRFLYGFQEKQELPYRAKLDQMRVTLGKKQDRSRQAASLEQRKVDQYEGALITLREVDKTWKNVTGG